MNYLLDTHTFLWFINDDKQMSRKAINAIANPDAAKFIDGYYRLFKMTRSGASGITWESQIKLIIRFRRFSSNIPLLQKNKTGY